MNNKPYSLKLPKTRETPVVFASPHSGREYSRRFLRKSVLNKMTIRSSEDAFVDMLFDSAPQHGAVFIAAKYPRAFIDLNRSADELDPALIEDVKRKGSNPRIAAGLGVVPRVVSGGRAIYRGKIPREEANRRISECWRPYHDTLFDILAENRKLFGQAILVDCHSMPHEASDGLARTGLRRPDIVLGDRFGASASEAIVSQIEEILRGHGLHVLRNTPFAGAFTAKQYGRAGINQHVVQIEIDRALYMNEQLIRPNGNFSAFQSIMRQVTEEISQIGRREEQLAAE